MPFGGASAVEGLLSTGPTPSSLQANQMMVLLFKILRNSHYILIQLLVDCNLKRVSDRNERF